MPFASVKRKHYPLTAAARAEMMSPAGLRVHVKNAVREFGRDFSSNKCEALSPNRLHFLDLIALRGE
jgi:hypothetical protein